MRNRFNKVVREAETVLSVANAVKIILGLTKQGLCFKILTEMREMFKDPIKDRIMELFN